MTALRPDGRTTVQAIQLARQRALQRVKDAHRAEYERYYAEERQRLGMGPANEERSIAHRVAPLPPQTAALVVKLYANGKSAAEVGRIAGVSATTVLFHARRAGLAVRARGGQKAVSRYAKPMATP